MVVENNFEGNLEAGGLTITRKLSPTARAIARSLLEGHYSTIISPEMGEKIKVYYDKSLIFPYNKDANCYADAYGYIYAVNIKKEYNILEHGMLANCIKVYEKETKKFVGTIYNYNEIILECS